MKFLENYLTLKTKAYVYSLLGGSILLIFWLALNQWNAATSVDVVAQSNTSGGTTQVGNSGTVTTPAGLYKDGTYQASNEIPWGTLTVAVTVENGQWTKVDPLAIPDSNPSQFAAPRLAKQALLAQNSQIDGVSGATYTSQGFRDDLAQIIAKSKN